MQQHYLRPYPLLSMLNAAQRLRGMAVNQLNKHWAAIYERHNIELTCLDSIAKYMSISCLG